jgi:APA family basic amino acid/polyamine antiporter
MSKKEIGFYTATSIVIANMIGTGVFTSLGFQVLGLHSLFALLLLWFIGGIVALCGALSYSELASAMPRSGSEYHYLSKIYHPAVGFLSGWVSLTVGFSAPVALSAMLMGGYVSKVFPEIDPVWLAIGLVGAITLIHSLSLKTGSRFQNVFTALKIALIVFIIIAGLISDSHQNIQLTIDSGSLSEISSSAFFISLFWVSYSYSGWNASSYIAGDIESPKKNVPRSLLAGTAFVMLLYILLNFVFLYTTPIDAMAGQKEVGFVAAKFIFGETGGNIVSMIIALLLVSSVSSMIIAGPRVSQVMGEDNALLRFLSIKNKANIPYVAIIFQSAISIVLILTSTFEEVLIYVGFTLNIFTFLTVLGLIIYRIKKPNADRPYKTWGYPITPLLFLGVTLWILYYGLVNKPYESLIGIATVLCGLLFYYIGRKNKKI